MSQLFGPLKIREVELKNRIVMSPMCQYSAKEGLANEWHLVHLGSRAVGGAGVVMVEATAVVPEGRISLGDTGLWSDAHADAFKPITAFIKAHGAAPAIQIAHAGRKASCNLSWNGGKPLSPAEGAWQTVAPSAIPFDGDHPTPRELSPADLEALSASFVDAARRSRSAGFDIVEIHMAHGYLLHEFLSPISNHRTDAFGGSLENRMRFPLQVAAAVRRAWPASLPVFVRISCTDWTQGGWDLPQSITFAKELSKLGIDLIDCSSGGMTPNAMIPVGPGFQVRFAEAIRKEAGIATGAVGMITDPKEAEQIVADGRADVVLLGRELLRNPYWPHHAAKALGAKPPKPVQYLRS